MRRALVAWSAVVVEAMLACGTADGWAATGGKVACSRSAEQAARASVNIRIASPYAHLSKTTGRRMGGRGEKR